MWAFGDTRELYSINGALVIRVFRGPWNHRGGACYHPCHTTQRAQLSHLWNISSLVAAFGQPVIGIPTGQANTLHLVGLPHLLASWASFSHPLSGLLDAGFFLLLFRKPPIPQPLRSQHQPRCLTQQKAQLGFSLTESIILGMQFWYWKAFS